MTRLSGKTALVTGGARGIGGGIALGLAREKVRVAAADIIRPDSPEFKDLLQKAEDEGIVQTPMWDDVLTPQLAKLRGSDPETTFLSIIKERIPLGRAQTVEDITQAVIYLCE